MKRLATLICLLAALLLLVPGTARAITAWEIFVDEGGTGYYYPSNDPLKIPIPLGTATYGMQIGTTLFTDVLVYKLPAGLDVNPGFVKLTEGDESTVSDLAYFINMASHGGNDYLAFFSFGGTSRADTWTPQETIPDPESFITRLEGAVYSPGSGEAGSGTAVANYHFLSDDVPEPGTITLLFSGLGLLGLGALRRRG